MGQNRDILIWRVPFQRSHCLFSPTPLYYTILYYIIPKVNSILRNVASKLEYESEQLEDLYERTAWALETRSGLPASSYDLFKKAVV